MVKVREALRAQHPFLWGAAFPISVSFQEGYHTPLLAQELLEISASCLSELFLCFLRPTYSSLFSILCVRTLYTNSLFCLDNPSV